MTADLHLTTGAAALDALPDDESTDMAAHLAECPTCQPELAGFLETAAMLGAATAQPAPQRLREVVLEAIRRTPQLPPLTAPAPVTGQPGRHREPAGQMGSAGQVGSQQTRESAELGGTPAQIIPLRPWYRRPQLFLAAAVAALVIGGGVAVVVANSGQHGQAVASCISTATDRKVLVPADGKGGDVVSSPTCGQVVVTPAGLPALPSGRVYQLWALRGSVPTSVGVMATGADGSVQPLTAKAAAGTTAYAVTVEPTGGSTKPTTTPIWVTPTA